MASYVIRQVASTLFNLPAGTGGCSSISQKADGTQVVAYWRTDTDTIYIAESTDWGENWSETAIKAYSSPESLLTVAKVSLTIDDNDKIYLFYAIYDGVTYSPGRSKPVLATDESGSWVFTDANVYTQDQMTNTCMHFYRTTDSYTELHLAWIGRYQQSNTYYDVCYRPYDTNSGMGTLENVTGASGGATQPGSYSLALSTVSPTDTDPLIVYFLTPGGGLYYPYFAEKSGTWTKTQESTNDHNYYVNELLVRDSGDNVWLGYDESTSKLNTYTWSSAGGLVFDKTAEDFSAQSDYPRHGALYIDNEGTHYLLSVIYDATYTKYNIKAATRSGVGVDWGSPSWQFTGSASYDFEHPQVLWSRWSDQIPQARVEKGLIFAYRKDGSTYADILLFKDTGAEFYGETGFTIIPSPATGVVGTVNPTVFPLVVGPSPASAVTGGVDPGVFPLYITPTPASGIAESVDPAVILGSISLTPSPSSSVGSSSVTVLGPLEVTPAAPASAIALSMDPSIPISTLPVIAVTSASDVSFPPVYKTHALITSLGSHFHASVSWKGTFFTFRNNIYQTIGKTFTPIHLDLLVGNPIFRTFKLLTNLYEDGPSATGESYDVQVFLDGYDVTDKIARMKITYALTQYCGTIDIQWADWEIYSQIDCSDIVLNYANTRIEVRTKRAADSAWQSQGQFFLEKRDIDVTFKSTVPSSWGRTVTAKLADPYAIPISQAWSSGVSGEGWVMAKIIAEELCATVGVTLSWEVLNYRILDNNFSITNELPINALERLASAVGGILTTNKSGVLRVVYRYGS